MESTAKPAPRSRTNRIFLRGLAIILPTVLTIWVFVVLYQFVQQYIAAPINAGVREVVLVAWEWPTVSDAEVSEHLDELRANDRWRTYYKERAQDKAWLVKDTRRAKLAREWQRYYLGLDLIGLLVAVVLIYIVGALLSGFIGRRIYHRGEELINRVPIIRRVYPAVKQVTDFFVGDDDDDKKKFNRVVAVEYPRKGIWSVGLVTGQTMRTIEGKAGVACLTIFIPSSPTPVTGYVITVPESDTVDLPVSIEDALKFAVSLGVVIPRTQMIGTGPAARIDPGESDTPTGEPPSSPDRPR